MELVSQLKQFFAGKQEEQESELVQQTQLQPQSQKNILEQAQGHLSDLADSGHTFWKFSQSEKGKSAESVYARYIPGEITTAKDQTKKLSFVAEENIAYCWMYGDQLTKLGFDKNDPRFQSIAETKYKNLRTSLGEMESEKLMVEDNYSMGDIETIKMIMRMSSASSLRNFLVDSQYGLCEKLRSFGFHESADLVQYIYNNFDIVYDEQVEHIKNNIEKIVEEFKERNATNEEVDYQDEMLKALEMNEPKQSKNDISWEEER